MTDRTAIIVLHLRGDGDVGDALVRIAQELRFTQLAAGVEIDFAHADVLPVAPAELVAALRGVKP